MGVLNVTPDSFSDGGRFQSEGAAVTRALQMVKEGADIIDVGGESTRPGATPVSIAEEIARVAPVIENLSQSTDVRISIDTRHYDVACEAVRLGATILNDITGGRDIRMAQLAREKGLNVCLMHMQGDPQTMQDSPRYLNGVVSDVKNFLRDRVRAFEEVGVPREHIWVDPGIGFGKTVDHNLDLLRHIKEYQNIAGRIVVGTSRKSFLAHVVRDPSLAFDLRLEGTIASNLFAYSHGASVFRVHEVGALRRALTTWDAILYGTNSHCSGQ